MGDIERIAANAAIIFANGLLVIGYYLFDHLAFLLVLALSIVWIALVERGLMAASGFTPPRGGKPSPSRPVSPMPLILGTVAALTSLMAVAIYPSPVREIMVAMWFTGIMVILALPSHRWESVPNVRLFLLGYALLLLLFRPLASWTQNADPYAWAKVFGSTGEAQQALSQGRSLAMTMFTWLSWFAVPGGFFTWTFQRLAALGFSLVDPRATAAEIVQQIRARGA